MLLPRATNRTREPLRSSSTTIAAGQSSRDSKPRSLAGSSELGLASQVCIAGPESSSIFWYRGRVCPCRSRPPSEVLAAHEPSLEGVEWSHGLRQVGSSQARFLFGGVEFELSFGSDPCRDALPSLARSCPAGQPSIARVRLELERFVPSSAAGCSRLGPRPVVWRRQATGMCVRAGDVRAFVRHDSAASEPSGPLFRASVRSARGAGWLEHVCSAVHAAVVSLCGGLVMHAASVWHEGRVWAFLGPSGAGKSTAAQLLGGALYSVDRLVLWPPGLPTPWVSALPGGTPSVGALSRQKAARLPLAALLRVRQAAAGTARVQPLGPLQAFASLRESVLFGASDRQSHQDLLAAVERVYSSVAVAELYFGLGAALPAALAAWAGQFPPPQEAPCGPAHRPCGDLRYAD